MAKAIQLGILLLFCISALAQTSITGTFKYPDGTNVTGYVTIALIRSTVTNNCHTPVQIVTVGQKKVSITNGTLGTLALYATTCIAPAQSYKVVVYDNQRTVLYRTSWVVPDSTPPVNVTVLEPTQ